MTDPRRAGLEAVEQESADEAQILRDIDASDKDRGAGVKNTAARRRNRKKT
jgi:hypothetical protein